MSFRRRGEVVPGRGTVPHNPMLNRATGIASTTANRMLRQQTGEMSTRSGISGIPSKTISTAIKSNVALTDKGAESKKEEFKHPGIKPSIVLSNINCVSTGTKDIDTVLIHGGLPTNCSLLIEEDGSTDFSGVLMKSYISEGIIQNRKSGKIVNHCIVVGMDNQFGNELPDVYAGNKKERKKKFVQEQEGKLSVSNINSNNELKIAWRYRKDITGAKKKENVNDIDDSKYPEYNHQFDITTVIRPSPGVTEISYISLHEGYDKVLENIKRIADKELKDESKMIRLAIPYMLNPMIYGCEELVEYNSVIKFIFGLRRILNSYQGRISMMATLSSELYEDTDILKTLEDSMFDGIIRLVPFPHELNILMEKVYKTQREKIKQGYVDIYRIPILSSMGLMERRLKEYSFKNSKSNFHVEQWSIPVEEEDIDENKKTDF
jgi:elongator complex protein 4